MDNHWRVTPGIEIIDFRVVTEESTRQAMIDAGDAQMSPTTFDDIPRLDADPNLKVVSLSGTRFPAVYLPGEYLEPQYDPRTPHRGLPLMKNTTSRSVKPCRWRSTGRKSSNSSSEDGEPPRVPACSPSGRLHPDTIRTA